MTQVRLALHRPGADGVNVAVSGVLEWRQSAHRVEGNDVVLPDPFYVDLRPPDEPVIDVDPTAADWAWVVTEWVRSKAQRTRYLMVPDTTSVLDYEDLVEVDPDTLAPVSGGTAGSTWVKKAGPMTQAEYDALPTHAADTLYLIRA